MNEEQKLTAEQRLIWSRDVLIRGMQDKLRGSITFNFNNGILENCQITANHKVSVDDKQKEF
jgi:hypothetical protein